ncbi:MAG: TonB family protein [Saprospiraceae bacterium]|jgi:TonB family protein
MKKERTDKHFIKHPVYVGGLKAMRQFISNNIKYPDIAKAHKIEGTVVLKYTINYKGEVIETKIMKGLGYGCDEEAIRLTKLLRFKIPKTRKIKVLFHKSIQIHFRLPKTDQSNSTPQYHYTPSNTNNSKAYTISIKF